MLKKLLLACITCFALNGLALAAVNINTATQEQLEALPDIGPAKARAILDYRKANGAFKRIDDLKNVKGIGDKTLDKLRPCIFKPRTGSGSPSGLWDV
ncbi:MAG: competence protein ComE [Candidatus Dactylopiibacterium carminicum]|uniref:Competence protein ComE n=1 Tax=Candidatus Dactylopiibacterium carminicum TaxID=857335 RepID=A0A272ENK4_9RHOO|nr:helix-hairpin-helix domain-containing protein [Candidatus Dactylopiibacterium carminicum]KAF7598093.1 competence protein ComE [Candidatus Dactylopiibacterium carminicum]PAS91688.1 MAG: competence protein ComE [Candidatus Dactylopiibacterium carminicum]PAS93679.1 MAG: competence protein ComE [Candidatus Dactylopiibacterium carminicum]PAS96579.1 MAG: hypothetical protein BSR46_15285 [Candidatus Dactylopiibacterium carminicum]